jgi:Nucleotidyl transferase AbiEii toxin, Type IV TA system
VSARSEPRTTLDIDLALAVSGDPSAEALVHALRSRGYRDNPRGALLEHKDAGRMAGFRLLAPGADPTGPVEGSVLVDILFASSGVENEIVAAADKLEVIPGVFLPVARTGHLLALKVLAGRPRDLEDCRVLLRHCAPMDLDIAMQTMDLISRRGFDRGKDLPGEFGKVARAVL